MSQSSRTDGDFDESPPPTSDSDSEPAETNAPTAGPTDATEIPAVFASDSTSQAEQEKVLDELTGTASLDIDAFDEMERGTLKLSQLERMYNKQSKRAINTLSKRQTIEIDEDMCFQAGTGKVTISTEESMLDYHLTVGNGLGLGALIPNTITSNQFMFDMDLKKPYREFKGKHGLVGFDTKGRMLYIRKCMNDDVFLAMAPKSFVACQMEPCPAGHSTGSSRMSTRHSRMVILMLLNFLPKTRHRSFTVRGDIYDHNIDTGDIGWAEICVAMYVLYNNPQPSH